MGRDNFRDNFIKETKNTLGKRVGFHCSNPDCFKPTVGPTEESDKSINVGVAAHICAASEGGPRYDPAMTPDQRKHIDNGIWLCQTCAKLVQNS